LVLLSPVSASNTTQRFSAKEIVTSSAAMDLASSCLAKFENNTIYRHVTTDCTYDHSITESVTHHRYLEQKVAMFYAKIHS
jgi:hypothetical protein